MEWIVLKMILSLGAVMALMFGLVFVLKRFGFSGGNAAGSSVPIQVLGRKSLQPKKSVVVLKIAGKVIVVGMSEQGMQTLTELAEEDVRAVLDGQALARKPERNGSFAAQLQATVQTIVNRKLEKNKA